MTEYQEKSCITVHQEGNEIFIVVKTVNNDLPAEIKIANEIVFQLKPLLESMLKTEKGIVESEMKLEP